MDDHGAIAEFCQLLFTLLVPHADDFGRLHGDPATIKRVVHPSSPRPVGEFAAALACLDHVELIDWYTVDQKRYIQIEQFEQHQRLERRNPSRIPDEGGANWRRSEDRGENATFIGDKKEEKERSKEKEERRTELKRRELKASNEIVNPRGYRRLCPHVRDARTRRRALPDARGRAARQVVGS